MRNYSGGSGTGTPDLHGFYQQDTARAGTRYYPAGICFNIDTNSIIGLFSDMAYAMPLLSTRGITVAGLHVIVTTAAAAGKKMRLGIYDAVDDTSNLYPNNLIVDAGEFLVDGVGLKSQAISQKLTAGKLYWAVAVTSGNPQIRGFDVQVCWSILGSPDPTGGISFRCAWTATHAYGALQATFPTAGSVVHTGAVAPMICVTR